MEITLKNGCKLERVTDSSYRYGIPKVMVRIITQSDVDNGVFTEEAKAAIREGIERLRCSAWQ